MADTGALIERVLSEFTLWSKERSVTENMSTYHFKLFSLLSFTVFCYHINIATLGMFSLCVADSLGLSTSAVYWMTVSLYFGEVIGCLMVGVMADVYGRKPIIIGSSIIFGICCLITGTSNSYGLLVVAQVCIGFCVAVQAIAIALVTEYAAPAERGMQVVLVGVIYNFGNIFGVFLLWIGEFTQDKTGIDNWRDMSLFNVCAMALAVPLMFLWIMESPRWLVAQGREKEAMKVLEEMSQISQVDIKAILNQGAGASETTALISAMRGLDKEGGEDDADAGTIDTGGTWKTSDSAQSSVKEVADGFVNVIDALRKTATDPDKAAQNWALLVMWTLAGALYYGLLLSVTDIYYTSSDDDDTCSFDYPFYFAFFSFGFVGSFGVMLSLPYATRFQIASSTTLAAAGSLFLMMILLATMGTSSASISFWFILPLAVAKIGHEILGEMKWMVTPRLFPSETRSTITAGMSAMNRVGGILIAILVDSSVTEWVDYLIFFFMTLVVFGAYYLIDMENGALHD